jgi:hypothetical protein
MTIALESQKPLKRIKNEYYEKPVQGYLKTLSLSVTQFKAGIDSLPTTTEKIAVFGMNLGLTFGWINSFVGSLYMGNEQIEKVIDEKEPLEPDFFHPFGEWPGQLASYLLMATALNYWVMNRGAYH